MRDDDIYEESETLFIELIDPVFVVLEHPDIVEVTIVDPEDGKLYKNLYMSLISNNVAF